MANNIRFSLSVLACVSLVSAPVADAKPRVAATPAPTSNAHPTARLIVQRAPNFGSDLVVRLWIDGKRAADIPRNQHYGGFVSAGRHTLTALALPNTESRRPTPFAVTAKAGQVYIFTATWSSDRLVLQPSSYYAPTTRVGDVRSMR